MTRSTTKWKIESVQGRKLKKEETFIDNLKGQLSISLSRFSLHEGPSRVDNPSRNEKNDRKGLDRRA